MLHACAYCRRKLKRKPVCKRCRDAFRRIDNRLSCARYYAENRDAILTRRKLARKKRLAATIPM